MHKVQEGKHIPCFVIRLNPTIKTMEIQNFNWRSNRFFKDVRGNVLRHISNYTAPKNPVRGNKCLEIIRG